MSIRNKLKWDPLVMDLISHNMLFWKKTRNGLKINSYQFIRFMVNHIGLLRVRILNSERLAIVKDKSVELVDTAHVSQLLISFIQEYFPNECSEHNKTEILDTVVESSNNFYNPHVLNFIPIKEVPLHNDTAEECYVPYENVIIKVTKEGVVPILYSDHNTYVHKTQIVKRKFKRSSKPLKGEFYQFTLNLADQNQQRFDALCSILGYLLHRYKDPSNPKMIILIDQVIGELESHNGGSGKSLWLKAVGFIRLVVGLSGKQMQRGNRFLMQRVEVFTDVILLNDASRDENLEMWFNYLTDDFVMERKYKQEQVISAQFSPKVALTSNHMIKRPEGNSSERRVHEMEVSAHYGKHLTPQQEFGHNLYEDWSNIDWIEFDNFMMHCIQLYLQKSLIDPPKINILKRKLISEVGVELLELLDEKVDQGMTKFHKKDLYDEFIKGGYVDRKYIPKRNTFTRKMRKYFEYKGLEYNETPSDKKLYFELITDEKKKEITMQTIKDRDINYKLIDTNNKLTRLINELKRAL